MDWLLPFRPTENRGMTVPGLPRSLLRRVLRMGRISVGSKVLDVGCGRGELTRYLDELLIDASGFDESAECVAAAQSAAGHLRYVCGSLSSPIPFAGQSLDMVLVRDLPEHRGDLVSRRALRATAHLLAAVRPEGCLIVMSRVEGAWSNPPGGHLPSCYHQHLESFPGLCRMSYLADSVLAATTWNWMAGRQPRAGFIIAQLAVSAGPRTCQEWEQIADQAALRRRPACCAWGTQAMEIQDATRISA